MLEVPFDILEQMIAQANEAAPIEACGILSGCDEKVEKFYKMTNIDNSSTHFMMQPEEQFAVTKKMRTAGLRMLAIYHSHPETPARPSAEDIRLAFTPDVTYAILSLAKPGEPDLKSFKIEGSIVTGVPVRIVKG